VGKNKFDNKIAFHRKRKNIPIHQIINSLLSAFNPTGFDKILHDLIEQVGFVDILILKAYRSVFLIHELQKVYPLGFQPTHIDYLTRQDINPKNQPYFITQ
jgi:hypothetical protein